MDITEDDDAILVSSDSEEDESRIWIKKSKNKQFQLLWKNVQPILLHQVLVEYKTNEFPYGRFKELAEDLRKSLSVIVVESTKAFIWKNIIQWLTSMRLCYDGISDLKGDKKYNLILTDFMTQYMNYKCDLYSSITDESVICEKVDEILFTLEVVFNGDIPGILMTLLKIEIKNEYRLILEPIFRKYLSNRSLHEPNELISYLRLIFCYRQWKKLASDKEEREKINEIAVGKLKKTLRSENSSIPVDLTKDPVLPKIVPAVKKSDESFTRIAGVIGFAIKNKAYGTRILLINKSLDLEEAIVKYFQQYEKCITQKDTHIDKETQETVSNDKRTNETVPPVEPKPPYIQSHISQRDSIRVEGLSSNVVPRPSLLEGSSSSLRRTSFPECKRKFPSQNNYTIRKGETNAVNQHLTKNCDISNSNSKLSSNRKQNSRNFKKKTQNITSDVFLSYSNNKKIDCIELDSTDDETTHTDKETQKTESNDKQTNETMYPVVALPPYIQRLQRQADNFCVNVSTVGRDCPIVFIPSSDEDEVFTVDPAKQSCISNTNPERSNSVPLSISPEVDQTDRLPHRIEEHGEKVGRKEKLRCITGEVSSTTSLDFSSVADAESFVVPNAATLDNSREVRMVRTFPESESVLPESYYSDISDDDDDPISSAATRPFKPICWNKFSIVVEEATSSTSEIPLRAGSGASSDNVIFSIHAHRARRSNSSSPCPTRTSSPTDSCTNIASSTTIRTGSTKPAAGTHQRVTSASRIKVRRLNSLIGVQNQSDLATRSRYVDRPPAMVSFDSDSTKRSESTRQNTETVTDLEACDPVMQGKDIVQEEVEKVDQSLNSAAGVSLESEDYSEAPTCSRYVGPIVQAVRRASQVRTSDSATDGTPVTTTTKMPITPDVSSKSEVNLENSTIAGTPSVSADGQLMAIASNCNNSSISKLVEDISVHIGDSVEESHLERSDGKSGSIGSQEKIPKSFEPATVKPNGSGHNNFEISLASELKSNDVKAVVEVQKLPREIAIVASATLSIEPQSDVIQEYEKQDILRNQEPGSVVKSSEASTLKIPKSLFKEHNHQKNTAEECKSIARREKQDKVLKTKTSKVKESKTIPKPETADKSHAFQRNINSGIVADDLTSLLTNKLPNSVAVEYLNKSKTTSNGQLFTDTSKSSEFRKTGRGMTGEENSMDALSTSLMEDELSNDEEIESPAYEPISPIPPEKNKKTPKSGEQNILSLICTETRATVFDESISKKQFFDDTFNSSAIVKNSKGDSSKDQNDKHNIEDDSVSDKTTDDLTNNSELSEVQKSENDISKDGSENHSIEDPAIETLTSDSSSKDQDQIDDIVSDLTKNSELPKVKICEDDIPKDGNENHTFEDSVTNTLTSEGSSKDQIDVSDDTTEDLTNNNELFEVKISEDDIPKDRNENHSIEDPEIETLTSAIVSDNTTEDLTDNIELPEVQMSEDNIPKDGNEKYSIEDTATETLTSDGSSKDQIDDSDNTTEDLTDHIGLPEVPMSEDDISKDRNENHSIKDPAIETLTSEGSSKDQIYVSVDTTEDLTNNNELLEVEMSENDIPKDRNEKHSIKDPAIETLNSEGSLKDQIHVSDNTTEDLTKNIELLEVQIFEGNISKDEKENQSSEYSVAETLSSEGSSKDKIDDIVSDLTNNSESEDNIPKDGNENHSFEDSVTKTLTSESSSKNQIDVSDNTTDDLTTKSELSEAQNSEDYISKDGNENHRIEDPEIETLTSDIVSDNTTEDLTDNIELPEVQMSEDNIPEYGNEKYSIEDTATETLTSDGSSKDQINDIVNDNTTEDLTDHIGLPEVPMSEDDIPRDRNENPSSEDSVTKSLTSEGSSKDQIDVSDDTTEDLTNNNELLEVKMSENDIPKDRNENHSIEDPAIETLTSEGSSKDQINDIVNDNTTEDLTNNIELPEVQISEDDILKDRSENQSFENQSNKMSGNEKETVNYTKEALSHQTIEDEQQIESKITADITSKDANSLQWTGQTQSSVDRIPTNETMKDYAYKQKDHCNEHTPEKPTCIEEKFILQDQCPLVKDQTVAENVLNNGELRAQEQLLTAVTTACTIDVHNQLMDAPEVTSEEIPEINKETEKSTDNQKIKVKLSEKETKPFTERGIEREHKINKLTEVTNTRVKYSDEALSVQVEFITPDESQIEESTEDVTPDVSKQLIATDCLVTKKNLANRKFSKEIISATIEVSHDDSTLEECRPEEKFIQKIIPKAIITPGLEMHKETFSDSIKITSLSEKSAKITGSAELQSGSEKASAPAQRPLREELIYDKQIVSVAKSHETAKEMKSEFDNIRTIKEITDTKIVYTKATSETEPKNERPATFKESNKKSSGNAFETISILKSNEKTSLFSSCSSEAELLVVLNLRRTEVPTEDDSNLSTQVQVTTEDLGDPTLSFDSETSDNLPGYPENGYHTPKKNFEEPCFHAEDQEVSEITSQEGDHPYNTYHDDCGTPVLDEKTGEEIESPKSPREITSLSILKEICNAPKNESSFYQNSSRCLPMSARSLGLDSPFSSLALHSQMKINQDNSKSCAIANDNISTTPKTSKLGFIEPSPKQKSTIETDFEFQGTPKMRFKRQMSQCADINEEFNMGLREQPVKHMEISKVYPVEKYGELVKDNSEVIHVKVPLPNYSVPLNLVMRPDKHSTSSNINVKFPQTTTESVEDTFILEEEDQNLRFPESQLKKLGIPKTNHKPLSKELHNPTLPPSSKSLFAKSTDVPEVSLITKQQKSIENSLQYTPLCTKSGGRKKKPRRVRKLKARYKAMDDDSSSECHLTLPIVIQNTALSPTICHTQTINQTSIAEISYNSEEIKAATILIDMKSNKVDESLKIETEKRTKSRKTTKKKKPKQGTAQYVRLTRSTSQLMDKLPFSDTPVSPPANSSKSVGKKISREAKCFANQKSPISSSCESIWQQQNTQEILRSYTATSVTLPQRVEPDERKQIETENPLPLMNAKKSTTNSICSSDSDDAAKLVIDFGNKKIAQKSTTKSKKNKQRKGTGGKKKEKKKKKISEKITESLQKGKAVMKKENSSPEVKYEENILRSPNPVFKLTSEVDVYFPGAHRPDFPKYIHEREDVTIIPSNRVPEPKISDDEIARLYPTISLSEDALSTSKTMGKHGQKETPRKRKRRATEKQFSDINRIKEPTDVLTISVIGTKFAAKSLPTPKSRKVAEPKNKFGIDVKLKPIPCQKAVLLDEPTTEVELADRTQLKTAANLVDGPAPKPKAITKPRLSFGIDAILGNRIDSSQLVQEKTHSAKDQTNSEVLTSTSPQTTMTKETWLKNLSLKKTLNEVVKELSEAKVMLKSPTDSTSSSKIKSACSLSPPSTSMVGRLISTEKILLHDLKSSQTTIEKAARVTNRRKSLVTSKVMPLSNSIPPDSVHSNSEVDVLKIRENLKQLQSARNCRKRLRRTVRIVNAEPTENSEDNEQAEDSTSPKLPIQSSEARPTEISTEIVHLDMDASTFSEINRSESPISKSTQRLPDDCSLKNTNAIHIPKTTEDSNKQLNEKESIATKKSAVHKQKKSVQEDRKRSDALHSLLAVKSRGESQQQLKEISELKAAATTKQNKSTGSLLYAENANDLKTPVEMKNQIPEKIELQSTANLSEPNQIKLAEVDSKCPDNADIVKALEETQQKINAVVTETKTKTAIHKAKKTVETVTPPGDSTIPLKENTEFKATTNSVIPKQKEPTVGIPKCTDTTGHPLQQCKKVKVTTNQAEPTKKKTVDDALKMRYIEHSLDAVQTTKDSKLTLPTLKLLAKRKRADSPPSTEIISISKEIQCKLHEAIESPEKSKKDSQTTNLSSECQVAAPLAKRRKSEGKALRSTNAKQVQQQVKETSRVRVMRSKSIGEESKRMESTVGYTLKKTTQQPKEIDITKSDLHGPKYQEKSVDVKNDVNEIKTNNKGNIEEGISLKIKIDKDRAHIVNKDVKPKLVMQIRRVSIDETNLKMTLEKSSEVSKKHTKKPKRLHKGLAAEKSTETNDMSGWAEPRKEEQVEVVGHNNLDKPIQSKGTAATVEVGAETVAVIENTKAVGIPQQPINSIKTAVESSKNKTVVENSELVYSADEVPVSELVKEAQCKGNELSPVLITTSEAPKSNLVDPNSHKSTESIAVLSLEKEVTKGDLDITQSVVTTTMPDNEENTNELNLSQIGREAESVDLKSDSQTNNFESNLNDAPSKDESLKAIQPTHVTCAMDNDQDSKTKDVIQKSVQAYEKGANRLNLSCPKSRQKSIISIRRKRPVILLKKLRYKLLSSDLAEVDILVTEGSKTPTKVLDIPIEKKMPLLKTASAQPKRKRVSLDCHRRSIISPSSLRTRSVSENVIYNETSFKKIRLTSPIAEETIIAIDENTKASEETECPKSVSIKVEVNQKDENQRFDEQLELSIHNILGDQLLKTNSNGSSVTMPEILLTNRPQGFDSVPDNIFAGNTSDTGDTSDTVETKSYPLETTPKQGNHQMMESEIEAQNFKLDPDDNNGDLKELPLKKSNSERETEESENSVNLVNGYDADGSSTELEFFPFGMANITDLNLPDFVVPSEDLSEVLMLNELTPMEQSDCMISGKREHQKFDEDMFGFLGPHCLESEIDSMTLDNAYEVSRKMPKRNDLAETLTASNNEVSPDIELYLGLFSYPDLEGNQRREICSSKVEDHNLGTTSTPVKINDAAKGILYDSEPRPDDGKDDSVMKKPNDVQLSTDDPPINVSGQNAINYFVPAVEVSTEVGFETFEELMANSSTRYFPSPDLANSSNPNPSTITGEINQVNETTTSLPIVGNELALAFNLDSENARESKQNEKTKVESGSGLETLCQEDKSMPVPIMVDNGINKQPNAVDQMENHDKKVETSYSPSKTTTDKFKWSRAKLLAPNPSKLKDLSSPLRLKTKKSSSKNIISNIDVQTKLNVTQPMQNVTPLVAFNLEIAPNVSDTILDSSVKTVKENLSSSKEYNPTIENLSFPANLESIEEVQLRVALTKLPDLGEIVDSGYDVESDVSPEPEPPSKKKRIAKLSTNDLFDQLKRESPVNTIKRKPKPVLKQASSFDTDDNSSRDSALGLLTISESPDVPDTEVVLPTRFLPSMSPVLYPSMPLITTPPRGETTPEITNKNNSVSLIKTLPKQESSPQIIYTTSSPKEETLPEIIHTSKTIFESPDKFPQNVIDNTKTLPIKPTPIPHVPAAIKRDIISKTPLSNLDLKRSRASSDLKKEQGPSPKSSTGDTIGKSSPSKCVTLLPPTVRLNGPNLVSVPPFKPTKVHCTAKCVTPIQVPETVSPKAQVKSLTPRVSFSPLVTKIPEVDPLTIKKRPSSSRSNSGSPLQVQKPLKSILIPQSKLAPKSSRINSPSPKNKPVKPSTANSVSSLIAEIDANKHKEPLRQNKKELDDLTKKQHAARDHDRGLSTKSRSHSERQPIEIDNHHRPAAIHCSQRESKDHRRTYVNKFGELISKIDSRESTHRTSRVAKTLPSWDARPASTEEIIAALKLKSVRN